ncbi:type II toxin-antitoxin system antitoxin DNA ADP-ribosyl glycohydrolase DarG [Oceanobacillus timonensis]|uniref:type II toxin-antitoxin system antitoxin DNA ADP-ribosyl glycohydrolase DarG n=1 Tax=Oceanobacillus timonensis TaxID=1926285 RepID=UPI0009B94753|nr:macro domain-containing protein [Oceanobacillus timonensis]
MIEYKKGNLLEDTSEALVNTVNTVGVMGKGIALQFKQGFPDVFREYARACRNNEIKTGQMHVVPNRTLDGIGPKYIINFPTKQHWKEKSKMHYITEGLQDLVKVIDEYNIQSIAIPPLGCGNGGLSWDKVKALIEETFANSSVTVHVYEPAGSPKPADMKVGTKKPRMTTSRALLLASLDNYKGTGYRLSLLEVQKIAYFLQESGEPLKLNFEKNKYGPYAENLNFVLQRLEGHFIRGYGDRNTESEIYLIHSAGKNAYAFLKNDPDNMKRLEKVNEVIHGFETPYGLELLATVHWVLKKNKPNSDEDLIQAIHNWNERKKRLFPPKHILKASKHLQQVPMYK